MTTTTRRPSSPPPRPAWEWSETDAATERWVPVVGFYGLYEVSDLGRVRSLDRHDSLGRRRSGKVLRPSIDAMGGYHQYVLTPPAVAGVPQPGRHYRAHELVLRAFVGPRPAGQEACHGNGDPRDNRLSNLRWDTRPANARDTVVHGTALTQRVAVHRPRKQPRRRPGVCIRGHRLVAPNLTTGRRQRCSSCQFGHNRVNDARRFGLPPRDLLTEANAYYASLIMPPAHSE